LFSAEFLESPELSKEDSKMMIEEKPSTITKKKTLLDITEEDFRKQVDLYGVLPKDKLNNRNIGLLK